MDTVLNESKIDGVIFIDYVSNFDLKVNDITQYTLKPYKLEPSCSSTGPIYYKRFGTFCSDPLEASEAIVLDIEFEANV